MSVLIAFEASARHGSFTKAAEELALTQSAVSRQVQALEAQLDVALFSRVGRHIELTAAGALYHHELAAALARIRNATLQTIAHKAGDGPLHLAVLPTFGSKWLLPRMHDFYRRHPGVLVHIHSRIAPAEQDKDDMHAFISVGTGQWPGQVAHRLLSETLVVVASPSALPGYAGLVPADISQQALLNVVSRPHAWADWFEQNGLQHRAMRMGPGFELTAHLIQAAVAGIGIGLVPRILVQDEIDSGELVALFEPVDSGRSYYLTYATRYQHLPALQAFSQWLLDFAAN